MVLKVQQRWFFSILNNQKIGYGKKVIVLLTWGSYFIWNFTAQCWICSSWRMRFKHWSIKFFLIALETVLSCDRRQEPWFVSQFIVETNVTFTGSFGQSSFIYIILIQIFTVSGTMRHNKQEDYTHFLCVHIWLLQILLEKYTYSKTGTVLRSS